MHLVKSALIQVLNQNSLHFTFFNDLPKQAGSAEEVVLHKTKVTGNPGRAAKYSSAWLS